jgi:DNA-binding NtrC family response regulator
MMRLRPGTSELFSVIERAVVLAETENQSCRSSPRPDDPGASPSRAFDLPSAGLDFERLEESLLRQAVERSGGVHTRGAELLRMSYKTYTYRLKKFGIIPA